MKNFLDACGSAEPTCVEIELRGQVQGMGLRPLIYRLAESHHLRGWVRNTARGVLLRIEGSASARSAFLAALDAAMPALAEVCGRHLRQLQPQEFRRFEILPAEAPAGPGGVRILPDLAMCGACRNELMDAGNRRYLYPFITCTACGPRASILAHGPYERANTSMSAFQMCPDCEAEYGDPLDRRFHSQTNSCARCGPSLRMVTHGAERGPLGFESIKSAAVLLREGRIVAVKGIGGYHFLADACNAGALRKLREIKRRARKPFAVMFRDMAQLREYCEANSRTEALLAQPGSPIVLLGKRASRIFPEELAPHNPLVGAMLAYTPLHFLMASLIPEPLAVTSANISGEPICYESASALAHILPSCDALLEHDREILNPADDSVLRTIADGAIFLRRARGFSPTYVSLPGWSGVAVAAGGRLKNSIGLLSDGEAVISEQVGDLRSAPAVDRHEKAILRYLSAAGVSARSVCHDMHPDYESTRWALCATGKGSGAEAVRVQHHHAHILSCMAENGLHDGKAFGVCWDGSGYGTDGTIWGGEFLSIDTGACRRFASLEPFPLPGGESAVREPRRGALGLLYGAFGEALTDMEILARLGFSERDLSMLVAMLRGGVNSPYTSSIGRLFDAVSALMGICLVSDFEGEAAMRVEFELGQSPLPAAGYAMPLAKKGDILRADWSPLLEGLLEHVRAGLDRAAIAGKFHSALIDLGVAAAELAGERAVCLSGGCFQNARLLEGIIGALRAAGFTPLYHRVLPSNDAGLSLGQLAAARDLAKRGQSAVSGWR